MGRFGAQDAFERGVDTGEQATDAVADAGGFRGEVVVVANEHVQFGQGVVVDVDLAQGVRQGAGGVGDDVGVAGTLVGRSGS